MSDPQRQKQVLAVLLVVLGAAIGYRLLESDGVGRRSGAPTDRPGAIDSELAAVDMPRLDLEALQRQAATYAPGRDPFRYGAAPAPPPPPPPPRKSESRRTRPKQKARPAQTGPVRPPKRQPPSVDFVYLGSFGPEGRRIAVFTKDDLIFNAAVGDVLLDRFIVDKIGFESADIKFVGFPDAPQKRLEAGG
jgi:hypothetical protein